MKIVRDVDAPRAPSPDADYIKKAGSLNWLVMALRYDINYSTKELSRVADGPTLDAEYLMTRMLHYVSQTTDARIMYDRASILAYKPPKTRRKSTDLDDTMYNLVDKYNIDDGIPQPDDHPSPQATSILATSTLSLSAATPTSVDKPKPARARAASSPRLMEPSSTGKPKPKSWL